MVRGNQKFKMRSKNKSARKNKGAKTIIFKKYRGISAKI